MEVHDKTGTLILQGLRELVGAKMWRVDIQPDNQVSSDNSVHQHIAVDNTTPPSSMPNIIPMDDDKPGQPISQSQTQTTAMTLKVP